MQQKSEQQLTQLVEFPEEGNFTKPVFAGSVVQKPVQKPVRITEFKTDITNKDCEFLYKKIPWVKDLVNNIYIHPVEGDFEGLIDLKKFIVYNQEKFYQPTNKYYDMQCLSTKFQEGSILTIIKNSEIYRLIVAIDTSTKGIRLQDEDMFETELEYLRVWNHNKVEYINDLKKNNSNEEMILVAKYELSNALQDAIKGNVPISYRSINSDFIETVVHTIQKNSTDGDSFVRLLANLIVFLKINLSFVSSSVFVKRLREQIYLPGTLPFLTDADKLPEIFMVQNVPKKTQDFVLEKLEDERVKFVNSFFENMYIGSSLVRKPTKPLLWTKPAKQVELPDIKSICKNRQDVENENDEDIVFYTDDSTDEIYCFNIYSLYTMFQEQDVPTNPYTNRPFSEKFIQMFLTRYASKPLVKNIQHVHSDDLVVELEHLIERELILLENNLIEIDNPTFIEKFKSSLNPTVEPTKSKRRIARCSGSQCELEKCAQCKKELNDDKIATVFRNKKIYFCGYNCLETNKSFK